MPGPEHARSVEANRVSRASTDRSFRRASRERRAAVDRQPDRIAKSTRVASITLVRLAAATGVPGRAVTDSQFSFLEAEFPDQFALASWAERHALSDPGPAMVYARKALESSVQVGVRATTAALPLPYEGKLNAYLNEPAFKELADGRVFNVAKKIQRAGNRAVHESKAPTNLEAVEVVSALFQFSRWLAFTYGRGAKPDPHLTFDPHQLPAVSRRSSRRRCRSGKRWRSGSNRRPRRPLPPERVPRSWPRASRSWRRSERGWSPRWRRPRRLRSRSRRRSWTGRSSRPAATRSMRSSPRPAGSSRTSVIGSSRSTACPRVRGRAMSTTCCGGTTGSRWPSSKRSGR
ncbi:MAG: DUF4145 domain-containing protein [Acidimicrobiia bacterium]|nr:DUF4145 domain-containing protein [Acidimicrobiia bacterium]